MFDFDQYARRIGLVHTETTQAGLVALQRAQLAAIAFESIDPFLGKAPSLQPGDIWTQLVEKKRGGYCFQLNWLFGEALKHLGFEARSILGRVRMGAPVGGVRAHLAWIVTIDGQEWLADAGFGGPGPRDPVAIRAGEQLIGGMIFRLREDDATGELVLEWQAPDGWFPLFGFDESRFAQADLEGANQLCTFWSALPFRDNLMMSIRLPDGDVALMNRGLKRSNAQGTKSLQIGSVGELATYLRELFGLDCDGEMVSRIWERLEGPVRAAA
ncbi:arylamine N-acetyltransferase [Rhizobium grahamii]|uniref:Arylamine N-acetyltransferase n=1 Tax=Rhizobium grahamii TaxID=1120045 RepID=A0A5Q0C4N1_9HYPH|nr:MULTISPECIES: arylamine N-acetyltransferase [Rhizobium]QFY60836.1 arylamine N-acetyltransferase [Rhizobium grahamii]QRM50016.1 arylamine N-acetyltransferase [Rhizobium sp. BG6]